MSIHRDSWVCGFLSDCRRDSDFHHPYRRHVTENADLMDLSWVLDSITRCPTVG